MGRKSLRAVLPALAVAALARCTTPATDEAGDALRVTDGGDSGPSDAGATHTTDAGPADAGATHTLDAGVDGGTFNPLATVPRDEQWHFVPFSNAFCADGTTTGLGVNFTAASDDVYLFLAPGGGCWDETTCAASCAVNLNTGYDETHGIPSWSTFSDAGTWVNTPLDRKDPQNPLAQYNYVYVFYCTGDTHAGSKIASYTVKGRDGQQHPVHHLGYQNLKLYLAAVTATFQPQKVLFAGASAGGFGALTDYDPVARAFSVPVDMIDDSGPLLPSSDWPAGSQEAVGQAWNAAAVIPPGCTECAGDAGFAALAPYISATYPQARMALVSSLQDVNIRKRYDMDGGQYEAALEAYAAQVLAPLPNWRYFYLAGDTHTAIEGKVAINTPCGRNITAFDGGNCYPTLQQFIAEEMTGSDASWTNGVPPAGAPGASEPPPTNPFCSFGN